MEPITGELPCPHCEQVFYSEADLIAHVKEHHMLTWDDFYKIDHHYVTAVDGFHLSFEPTDSGFRLVVYGTLMEKPEPVPPHGEPTEQQKTEMLINANAFSQALRIAKNKELG